MARVQQLLAACVLDALAEEQWTQAALAQEVGVSQKHLSQILSGAAAGSLEMWDRLASALGRGWSVELL